MDCTRIGARESPPTAEVLHDDPVERLLRQLKGVKQSGDQYAARCPAHDDQNASLSVKRGDDGRALVHCHAGCDTADVVRALGLSMSDLMEPASSRGPSRPRASSRPQIVAKYDYQDQQGELSYQVVRFEPKDFRQRKPDGNGGWAYKLNGVARVPFRLPEVLAKPDDILLIVEGEKDVEAAERLGFLATTNAGGAGGWSDELSDALGQRRLVVIIADNDEAGRKRERQVARSVSRVCDDVRVVRVYDDESRKGYDLSDWIADGGDQKKLDDLIWFATPWTDDEPTPDETAARPRFEVLTSAELASGDYATRFLIDGTLVAGQPLIVAGPQKTLKTSLLIDAAVSLASGERMLGRLSVAEPVRVAVMTGESGLSTIQETATRVAASKGLALAGIENLLWSPQVPRFADIHHRDAVSELLDTHRVDVLIIDPAYLAMPGADAGNLIVQGELLRNMADVCSQAGATFVLAHHTKRNTGTVHDEPLTLSDIAWAGFPEFARQWWLLNRRSRYQEGSGRHDLWLSVGGSAGHSDLWAVDVEEGVWKPDEPRTWDVTVSAGNQLMADERRAATRQRDEEREQKRQEQFEAERTKVWGAIGESEEPQTASDIADVARVPRGKVRALIDSLLKEELVVTAEVVRGNGQKYPGYKLTQTTTQSVEEATL